MSVVDKHNVCYMVLDQGGHSNRVAVVDGHGKIVVMHQEDLQTRVDGARVEQDGEAIIESFKRLIDQTYLGLTPQQQQNLQAAGFVCQRSSIIAWNRLTGATISPVISWQDWRAKDALQQILREPEVERRIHQLTGLVPNAHLPASKIAWCLQHIDGLAQLVEQQAAYCAPLASFCVARLCKQGLAGLDRALAARTLLFDIEHQQWSDELLQLFAIPRNALPKVYPNVHVFGDIELPLGRSVPLGFVNGDQNAAFYAEGRLDPHTVYINVGTGAFCAAVDPGVLNESCRLLRTLVISSHASLLMLEGTVNGAASALDWGRGYFQEAFSNAAIAAAVEQDGAVPLFINGVGGLASPYWRADFSSYFIDEVDEPLQGMVGIVESIVFLLYRNITEMQLLGVAVRHVAMGGGLAQMNGLCQRLADLLRLNVHRLAEKERSVLGAAFWLSGCPSDWPLAQQFELFTPQQSSIGKRYVRWQSEMGEALGIDEP